MAEPKITRLELVVFEHEVRDMGTDYNGFNQVYEAGSVHKERPSIFRVHTDAGITGEYLAGPVGRAAPHLDMVAGYLIGKNPFERERVYNDLKRGLRHTDRTAIGSCVPLSSTISLMSPILSPSALTTVTPFSASSGMLTDAASTSLCAG